MKRRDRALRVASLVWIGWEAHRMLLSWIAHQDQLAQIEAARASIRMTSAFMRGMARGEQEAA